MNGRLAVWDKNRPKHVAVRRLDVLFSFVDVLPDIKQISSYSWKATDAFRR